MAAKPVFGVSVHRLLAEYRLDLLLIELSGAADCYPILRELASQLAALGDGEVDARRR